VTHAPFWDPAQYHSFGDKRLRPALELLSRLTATAPRVVHDIGTGGGEIARLMADRWPDARVLGSDSSPDMLAKARSESSTVEWQEIDIATWHPANGHDVIYANAALHWLGDHEELFPRLIRALAPGGELAVQVPLSWWQPSHEVIRKTLGELSSPEALELTQKMSVPNVQQASWYYDLVAPLVASLDIWETTYHQVLDGEDPVFEWVSGSIIRPVMSALDTVEYEQFARACRARLRAAYQRRADGTTLFPFRRLFMVARR